MDYRNRRERQQVLIEEVARYGHNYEIIALGLPVSLTNPELSKFQQRRRRASFGKAFLMTKADRFSTEHDDTTYYYTA